MVKRDDLVKIFNNLTGVYAHYCYDWDELPIDETCPEFACCTCEFEGLKLQKGLYQARKRARLIMENRKRRRKDAC